MGSSADAKLAWGVDLHATEYGELHESIGDVDAIEDATLPEIVALRQVVAVETSGYEFDGHILVIKRTLTWVFDYGVGEVKPETLAPPTGIEVTAVNAALDHLGYTGPRDIKLLLAANYG
jgi:hypothetical protein